MGKTSPSGPGGVNIRKHPHGRGEDWRRSGWTGRSSETPPRTWGRHCYGFFKGHALGNTPTDVGKTKPKGIRLLSLRKHPHGRGEDPALTDRRPARPETPPRTWGRRLYFIETVIVSGNTPTDVGKTVNPGIWAGRIQKHPHGRGEDGNVAQNRAPRAETPPRTWGRHIRLAHDRPHLRNTPTDVGKTAQAIPAQGIHRKHPHGRGEDIAALCFSARFRETPPRTWGRPGLCRMVGFSWGNTPTDVGKTSARSAPGGAAWKHPHGRGEDMSVKVNSIPVLETPPRTWGRRSSPSKVLPAVGNTPTDVGKTKPYLVSFEQPQKHPHGRGEDSATISSACICSETPPRTWGRRQKVHLRPEVIRNTPTDVGKTAGSSVRWPAAWKHPHGRGEDVASR